MISLATTIDDANVKKIIRKLDKSLRGAPANSVIAEAAAEKAREHLRELSASRHRPTQRNSFYLRAADAVLAQSDNTEAVVAIPHTGLALRYYGGTVRPSGRTSLITGKPISHLAIPRAGTEAEGKTPYDFRGRLSLIITARKKAYLGKEEPDGSFTPLFWLVKESKHDADKNVLPTTDEFRAAAVEALEEFAEEVANG